MKADKAGKSSKKKGGLSFRSDDAIETGLFASGPAAIKEAVWANFDYGGSSKPVPVLLVTFTRDGEENYEQPYSIGKGWKIKGSELIALNGQSGLPKSCNAMKYLIKPLEKALEASDAPDDFMDSFPENLAELVGIVVARVEQEKRNIKGGAGKPKPGGNKSASDDKERTILIIEEITEAEWIEGGGKSKSKTKAKAKAKDEDEDEDADTDDDDDADEDDDKPKGKSKGKGKSKSDDDDSDDDDDADEDEDEPPAKGKSAKAKVKAKPNGKAVADDDDDADSDSDSDSDVDDDIKEEGIEALVSALEANDGKLTEDELPDALAKVLKKNKNAKIIAAYMISDDGLELEKGWTYNSKRGVVTAD